MRKLTKFALFAALLAGLISCHGQSDEGEVKLTLLPSATTIVADGSQSVTFTVHWGANVVTPEAHVVLVSHPEVEWNGTSFSTEEAGEYIFKAIYQEVESEEVKVTATMPVGAYVSRFERHFCVMELTGAWCANCPEGYRSLTTLLSNPFANWKNTVHIIALHDNTGGTDPMGISLTNTIFDHYKVGGYPGWVTDMREGGLLTSEGIMNVMPSLESSAEDYPAHCDVKIASSLTGSELKVDVSLFAELAGDYAVSVWLLEDGIVAPQLDGAMSDDDWVHNHVARALLNNNWKGDLMAGLTAEQESVKSYTYTLPTEWKSENMSIMALAIDKDGVVNNVAVCAVGESVDYKYIAE